MLGAIANGFTNFANQVVSYNYNRDQRTWLEKQQRLAQSYNFNLAKQQNTWNIQQWNRENAYNSLVQQRIRYAQAGMNPDLVYSQGNLASQSPMLTSGAPTSPLGSDAYGQYSSWSNIVNEALQTMLLEAQIDNVEADTENKDADTDKKGEETKGLSIDNIYKALHHEQELKIGDTVVDLNIANTEVSKKDAEKIQYEIGKLVQETKNLKQERINLREQAKVYRQQVESMSNADKLAILDHFLNQKKVQAEIRLLAAQADITEQEATYFVRDFLNKEANLKADTKLKDAQRVNFGADTNLKKQQWQTNYKFSDKMQQVLLDTATANLETAQANARLSVSSANHQIAINDMQMRSYIAKEITLICSWFGNALGGLIGAVK